MTSPTNHLYTERWACMPYNFVTDGFHTNFVADFLQAKCDFTQKTAVLCFWSPLGDLGTMYDVHLRLIGKHAVDFLLALIEFFVRCYHWGATSEYWFKIGDFTPMGASWRKITHRWGHPPPHQPFFFSEN